MKKIALLVAIAINVVSCSKLLDRQESVTQQLITLPQQTIRTNIAGAETVVVIPSATLTNYVTNILFAPKQSVISSLQIAENVSGFVPSPFGDIASVAFAGAAGILGWIARTKSKKAGLLDVVIQGVESANSPETKKAIQKIAFALGKEKELRKEVKSATA